MTAIRLAFTLLASDTDLKEVEINSEIGCYVQTVFYRKPSCLLELIDGYLKVCSKSRAVGIRIALAGWS